MSEVSNKIKKSILGLFILSLVTVSLASCDRPHIGGSETNAIAGVLEVKSTAFLVVPNKDRVDVLDMQTNRVTQSLQTDQKPTSIAVSNDRRLVLVTNSGSGTVSVFLRRDNDTFQQLNSIGSGVRPVGIAFNPNPTISEAYVAYEGDSKILVLDTSNKSASPRITKVLSLQGATPKRMVVSPDGSKIYVTDSTNAQLLILTRTGNNFSRNQISLSPTSNNTGANGITNLEGLAIDLAGNVYIANNSADSVLVVNAQGNSLSQTISLKDNQLVGSNQVGPRNMTIYKNPNTGTETLYVAGYNASVVSVIDVKTARLIKNIPLTQSSQGRDSYNPVGVAVGTLSSKDDVIYVTNSSGLTLSLIDPANNTLKRNLSTTISSADQQPLGDIVTVGAVK
ncbi:MAG: SMP-30/gluconolactonase/LRE family protein [Candidatus Sericytochromatia bacterium]|nr:SMP-30/gluconolactonase/LRE family protein [Candidatus Sericytochromatia bacterium]